MKIAAYFQVHGIKVSGHKPSKQTESFKIIPLGISPDLLEALKWLKEHNRDFNQYRNITKGYKDLLNGETGITVINIDYEPKKHWSK